MTEASKSQPSALDAYESAKPTEPVFTLQGGDPLAAPLVRLWAYLSRVRAGLRGDVSWIDAPIYVAQSTSVSHDDEQVKNLLIRATEAEKISWHMDGYRRGDIELEQDTRVNELDRLDVYDVRRKCASTISNFFSELNDYREELRTRGFILEHDKLDCEISGAVQILKAVREQIEIRRGE